MIKEITSKKKRRLLKALVVCVITTMAFCFVAFAYEYNSYRSLSYKASEKIINKVIAKQLSKDPNTLTSEDFEKVQEISIPLFDLTSFRPLVKLKNLEKLKLIFANEDLNVDIDYKTLAKLKKLQELDISPEYVDFALVPKNKKWYDRILSILKKSRQSDSENKLFDLGRFKKLKNLESLTVEYPETSNLEALASFPKLYHLNIKRASVSDPNFLKELTNLKFLELGNTRINDINPIRSLVNLEYLGLWQADITDISSLSNLTNLKKLNLSQTKVENINALASLTNLKDLDLSRTPVSDIKPLAKLTNLQILTLHASKVTDITPLAQLVNLQYLQMSFIQIRDFKALESLTNLTYLNLQRTNINNIKPLGKLTNLQHLDLHNTQISDEQIAELQKSIPDLKVEK